MSRSPIPHRLMTETLRRLLALENQRQYPSDLVHPENVVITDNIKWWQWLRYPSKGGQIDTML